MKIKNVNLTDKIIRKNYFRSALPPSMGASRPIKRFFEYISVKNIKIKSVLDYGAGKRRDAEYCINNFSSYTPHDNYKEFKIQQPMEILKKHYDLVIFNYILNILILKDRTTIIFEIKEYLSKGSIILLAVRTIAEIREVKPTWVKYQDGWVTSRKTFQHFFNNAEIYDLFQDDSKKIVNLGRGAFILFPK
ncbi:MAG: hypothetical protein ACTSRI_14890 [Promethearchaeota archaeon]